MGRRQQGEGSVYYRRARGQWVAVAELPSLGGKRDRREFTSKDLEEALAKRAAFLAKRAGGFTLPKGTQPTVSQWMAHWLENEAKPGIGATTYRTVYAQKVRDYIVPFFAKIRLADLAEEDVKAWHRHLERKGLSPGTVGLAHKILSAGLNVAVSRRRLPHNPAAFASPPKYERPAIEPPSADEVLLVLGACRDRPGGARWVTGICTGLRQGEVLGLRWRDVRLAAPASVTVRQSLARVDGEWVLKPPKTAKSRRTVPLPAVAVTALKAHREGTADISGRIFGWAPRDDHRDWTELLASLGLPHYRVHDLRHGYATMLLEQGADPRVVQDLLGWSSAKMAEVYQHIRPVTHARVVSMLDDVFGA